MDKKKIAAIAGIALLLIIIISLVVRKKSGDDYIIDKSYNIKLKDIETFYKNIDFNQDSIKEYFSNSVVNQYTLKFFMSLDERFKDAKDLEDHLEKTRQYLYSVMSTDEADKLLAVYSTYLKYQKTLHEKSKEWGMPKNPEETIKLLHNLQEYRREVFGRETADILFGASLKAQEYPIRRGAIVGNRDLYGADKEKKLKELDRDMWGNEANSVEAYAKPYTRYQEKMQIYSKDMSELGADEKQAKIKKFREDIFTPEEVARLDGVDQAIAEGKQKEDNYRSMESRIMSDPNLDKEEKEQKVRDLQDQTFGEDADAFRRRQIVEKSLDMSQFKKK
jgi:lipase chaperone LimK